MEKIHIAATVAAITGKPSRWLPQLPEPTTEVKFLLWVYRRISETFA